MVFFLNACLVRILNCTFSPLKNLFKNYFQFSKPNPMQKISLLLNIIFLAIIVAFVFDSCKDKKENSTNTTTPDKMKEYYCNPCLDTRDISKSSYVLNKNLLFEMTRLNHEYSHKIENKASNGNLVDDSRAIWFSLSRLKGFIEEIERVNCRNSCDTTLALGVRMYFGVYPDPNEFPEIARGGNSDNLQNRHTIFMIPTYDDSLGFHRDFDPRQVQSYCSPPPPDGPSIISLSTLIDKSAMNHGDFIPPPYTQDSIHIMGAYFLK
jgi:hypothetical protein